MKKEDLLKFCRYYDGNDNKRSNDHDIQMLRTIERAWVDMMQSIDGDFRRFVEQYVEAGLKDFKQTDDTPLTLKSVLFNRFTQYNDRTDVEAFKKWYEKYYE